MKKISNVSLVTYRRFLTSAGCMCHRTKGGHEHWQRDDIPRALTLQNHIDPIPAFIIKQHLRYLDVSTSEFLKAIEKY
jgi:predicted RNA binding protein YcfA (HicA-like mRNA interferase family)